MKIRFFGAAGAVAALALAGCDRPPPTPPALGSADVALFLQDAGFQNSQFAPYIRGKVAVVNRTDKALDREIQDLLPPALKAETRADVDTVVWLDWSTEKIPGREYESYLRAGKSFKAPAMSWVAIVTVVDWNRKRILGGPRIAGQGPIDKTTSRTDAELLKAGGVDGPRPNVQIAAYLQETARAIAVPP